MQDYRRPVLRHFRPNEFIDAHPAKKKWSLEPARSLCRKLGVQPEEFRAVHIAGTNGKGSVAAFVTRVLLQQGYRVGTFTSPHLLEPAECIAVDGKKISAKKFGGLAREVGEVAKTLPKDLKPSFFEVLTAMAFLHFQRQKVGFVVAEVGLGGRLDSTNLLRPLVAVITNVSLEHTQLLGNTVAEIAAEKAGIIKKNSLVVTGAEGDALEEIRRAAKKNISKLFVVGKNSLKKIVCSDEKTCFEFEGKNYCVKLLGRHQALNAALAIKTIELLRESGVEASESSVQGGLQNAVWRGRLEIVSRKPLVVLDGAHNPAAARALAQAVKEIWPRKKVFLVLGVLKDKNLKGILRELKKMRVQKIIATAPQSGRAVPAQELALEAKKFFGKNKVVVVEDVGDALAAAKKICSREKRGMVLATGSLYLVREVLSLGERK